MFWLSVMFSWHHKPCISGTCTYTFGKTLHYNLSHLLIAYTYRNYHWKSAITYTVLCKMSFHQVYECSRAVHDGSRTVHEPVLCIGINGYKRSFECYAQLCEQVRKLLWAASFPWLIFCFLLQLSSSSTIQLPSKETDNNIVY